MRAMRRAAAAVVVSLVGSRIAVFSFSSPGRVRTRLHAKAPKVKPEPDFGSDFAKVMKESLGLNEVYEQQDLTAAQRVTPIDRLMGWDRGIIASRDDLDPFMDSMEEANYITVAMEKPLGLEFVENSEKEGRGVMVDKVAAGSNADQTGLLCAGYQLIFVDGRPVHGLSFDDAIQPIVDAQGPVRLTFFTGEPEYFYGDFRPEEEWLADFREKLVSDEEEQ
ncbi:unnamed protein product [Effrenium voratum]|nr:unnamed protein product [Effrenium voratum]